MGGKGHGSSNSPYPNVLGLSGLKTISFRDP